MPALTAGRRLGQKYSQTKLISYRQTFALSAKAGSIFFCCLSMLFIVRIPMHKMLTLLL